MCNFLSAIVKRDSELICKPDVTDSHEDLIDFAGLVDDGRGSFVRLELLPTGNDFGNVDEYTLKVDPADTPEWFTSEMRERVDSSLRERVRRMIVADDRKILLGGCWIVTDGAKIERSINATLRIDGGNIKRIHEGDIKWIDGGNIERIYGGNIERISGGNIEWIHGGTIKHDER